MKKLDLRWLPIRIVICFIILMLNIKIRILTDNDNCYLYWVITFITIILYFEMVEACLKKHVKE